MKRCERSPFVACGDAIVVFDVDLIDEWAYKIGKTIYIYILIESYRKEIFYSTT